MPTQIHLTISPRLWKRPAFVPLLLFLVHSTLFAADWPQWRGPNRDGIWTESGILTSLPATGPALKWKAPVGLGYSSPVIQDGRLYLTDIVPAQPIIHERTLCFDARSGKPLWTTQHDATPPDWFFVPAQLRGPGATPIVQDGRVYGLSMFSVLKCLDARTGTVLWQRDLVAEYQLPPSSLDASPLIDHNLLILSIGGRPGAGVVALDLATGHEIWRALDEAATWSSPVIISAGGTRQLIVWMRQSVTSLNPTNGAVYWREPTVSGGSPGFSAVSTPVLHGDRLLISGLMFQLDQTNPAAKVLWPDTPSGTRRILSDTSTPLFRDDFIYSPRSGGTFVCLEANTGRERWQTNAITGLRRGASVHFIPNGSTLFLYTDRGDLIRAELTPSGYREFDRAHLIDPTSPLFEDKFAWSAPSLANRNLYVRNDQELRCYSMADISRPPATSPKLAPRRGATTRR
jgi:outer membrane protein assembly factor BamB